MKKQGGDKIGLLGLFILALIVARFTVALKSAVKLSEPIPLPYTGLSVSMPVGNGWHSEEQWMYHDHTYILSSVFALQSGKTTAWAHCQSQWGSKTAKPEDRFAWKASEVDGEIVETGRTEVEALTVDWVHIERPDFLLTTFWGTARLPNGRQLDIEVHQIMSDPELSKRIFNRILNNLGFKDDPLLAAGAEVTAMIRNRGLDSHRDHQNRRTLYLIKNSTGRSVGFTMEYLVDSGKDARLNVKGESFLYIRDRNAVEQETLFQCSNNLDEFTYKSEIYNSDGRSSSEIVSNEPGTMIVRKFGPEAKVKVYYPGSAALPDVFFDLIFRQMLASDKREIVIDLIDADGKIIPTSISRIETEDPQAAHAFDLEFLDGQDFSQRVFLDEQGQIFRSLIQHENLYVFERTNAEDVAREFPDYAQRILQDSQTL